jgi:hypothetical protein
MRDRKQNGYLDYLFTLPGSFSLLKLQGKKFKIV